MAAVEFQIIYLDRRAREEGVYTRDNRPKRSGRGARTGPSASTSHYNISSSADEVDDNVNQLLEHFEKVTVVTSSIACYWRMNEKYPAHVMKTTNTKFIILVDVPYSEGYYYYTPPGIAEAQAATETLYGMQYFKHLVSSIRAHRLAKYVVPVILLSKPSTLPNDSLVINKERFPGAADILVSPLNSAPTTKRVEELRERVIAAAHDAGAKRYATLMQGPVSRLMSDICDPDVIGEFVQAPELPITQSRRDAVTDAIGTWSFSAHAFTDDELLYGALHMFQHTLKHPDLEQWRMPQEEFFKFLLVIREAYNTSVIYHNFRHACDVLQACFYFLIAIGVIPPYGKSTKITTSSNPLGPIMTPFNALVLLVSALGHDVGHPGVNNMFLVRVKATVAQLYNDHSVLESFHCALYSQLLQRFWPSVGNDIAIRKLMISTILATDMTVHGQYMKQLDLFRESWDKAGRSLTEWDEAALEQNRELLSCLLIKCADICNVAREFDIAKDWASLVTDEFTNQGKMEEDANIPTCLFGGPPPAGDVKDMAERQIGFMTIFVAGLFERMTDVLPGMGFAVQEINKNKRIWRHVLDEQLKSPVPFDGLDGAFARKPSIFTRMDDDDMIDIPPEASQEEPRMSEPLTVRPAIPVDPNAGSRRSSVQALSPTISDSGRRGSAQSSYKLSSTRTPSPRRGSMAASSHFQSLAQSSRDARRSSLGSTVSVG